MKETNRKKKFMKIFRLVLIVLCSVILVLGGTISLLLHQYISKLNIVTAKSEVSQKILDLDKNLSEEESERTDSGEIAKAAEPADTTDNRTYSLSEPTVFPICDKNSASDTASANIEDADGMEKESAEDKAITDYLQSIQDNIDTENSDLEESKLWNILLIGSDGSDTDSQGRSDSILLITLNKEARVITATSFLRDIYLKIPGFGEDRLNAAYAYGGAELLLDTLELNFKIKVDEYVKVDFFTFIDIIDALGGLTMDISKGELEDINSYIREMNKQLSEKKNKDTINKAGTYLLNGKQVLAFSRNRYSKNGEFDRTDRQRKILQALLSKVYTVNPAELNQLLNTILPQITTNITEGEILLQLFSMPSYTDYKINQFCIPVKDSFVNRRIKGMEVLCINFKENRKQLNSKLYHIE